MSPRLKMKNIYQMNSREIVSMQQQVTIKGVMNHEK